MSEAKEKWNVERIHSEVYDARTKLFVIAKVLEAGTIDLKGRPEWALVIRPLLKELVGYADKVGTMIDKEMTATIPE